ncbi:LppP/LprE family lipoprotein [Nocardia sp. NPDC051570]|uniref:LppP/LprE family lipoprotein n=1 Tax=Nocardia sp. NPDC051570 TaxID=3364324 RepID=UPI00378F03C7
MRRIVGIIVAVAAVTLSASACQDGGSTPAAGGSPAGKPGQSAASTTTIAPPGSGQSGTGAAPVTEPAPGSRPPGDHAPATAGNGACVDLKSPVVTAAINSLGPGVGGDGYYADSGTDASVGSCPDLLWVLAGTPRGTASSPWHVLLFNHAGYLGTATKNATSYTSVVGSTARSVAVQYRWLTGNDANCCPQGGPLVVTLTLGADGRTVTPDRDFPKEVTDPNP